MSRAQFVIPPQPAPLPTIPIPMHPAWAPNLGVLPLLLWLSHPHWWHHRSPPAVPPKCSPASRLHTPTTGIFVQTTLTPHSAARRWLLGPLSPPWSAVHPAAKVLFTQQPEAGSCWPLSPSRDFLITLGMTPRLLPAIRPLQALQAHVLPLSHLWILQPHWFWHSVTSSGHPSAMLAF